MKIYKSELGMYTFLRIERKFKALATCKGATSESEYVERFILLKEII